MPKNSLDQLREQIDSIDLEILNLLNQRAERVLEVAEFKSQESPDESPQFYRPEREAQVLKRLCEENQGKLSSEHITRIFREIISASLSLEEGLAIAYLGPAGTYTQSAVYKQFGKSVKTVSQGTIADVFHAIENGVTQYGVVPIENSTEGTVNQTLDCFLNTDLQICSEINLPIHHVLMSKTEITFDEIDTVYGHEQTLAQCRNWLSTHLPKTIQKVVSSNAEGARQARSDGKSAAIASEQSASEYGLCVLERHIEDQKNNTTRFLVLGRHPVGQSGYDKTSLLVQTANKAGALVSVLTPFKEHEISLSQVVSRPSKSGNWSYVFFIDFDGHVEEERVATTLKAVLEHSLEVKVLGSYPKAQGT